MADLLHEEILNFRVQSCPRVGGQLPPLPPFSYTTAIREAGLELELMGGPATFSQQVV